TLKTHVRARAESVKMTTAGLPEHTEPRPMSGPLADTALGAGAVIGRSRLVGDHGPPLARPMSDLAPSEQAGQPKTQYVRSGAIDTDPVAGWLVVVKGPGRGGYRPIFVGMNSVGRDTGQRISLNFGDDMISREEHAFIAYDEEARRFYLQHGGKANLVRLGGQPGLSPTELHAYDLTQIGKTTLRCLPLCCPALPGIDQYLAA